MRVVGFIGPSGTGKSHRASWVAGEKGIDFIIDDGLLIKGSRIVAGISAKRESTKIGSIKRALFTDNSHAEDVKKAIDLYKPEGIMILGTSDEMVATIAKRLGLPEVTEKVYIQDVASEYEIKQALMTRREQGKHVIPVPTFEIKKDFSGYFLDPLQIFKRKGKASYQLIGERSVVRPTFSYLGKYTISEYAIRQIVEYVTLNIEGVSRVYRFSAEDNPDGKLIEMELVLVYGYPIRPLLRKIQTEVVKEVEKLTGINIKSINLVAKSLVVEKNQSFNELYKDHN